MRVLIIKTSSMAEVVHTLPALTDAKKADPALVFDWVVEEDFAEIPGWHPAVDTVIPVALHRWRKHVLESFSSVEWRQFRTQLRRCHYDLVIDAQGLLKSAWLGAMVKAPVAGFDRHSVRESLAALSYRHRYAVSRDLSPVDRTRALFAQALGYELPTTPSCHGLDRTRFCGSSPEAPNVVLLHGTSSPERAYPEADWKVLADNLAAQGLKVRLPWSTDEEKARAQRIAADNPSIQVLPKLNLQGLVGVLSQAKAVLSVNSGLGHLSAALEIPTLFLEEGRLYLPSAGVDNPLAPLLSSISSEPAAILGALSPVIRAA